jgi:gluconokinase
VVIQWLKESLLQTEDDFEKLFALAATVGAGSEGLLFIPYILGERAPIWNSKARGIYFGLSISHSRAHLIKSAMEGVVYCLYSIGKILMEDKEIRELHATGGFARSPFWLQMLADVFNLKVLVFGEDESSALGAVVTGLEAMGLRFPFSPLVLATYEPDATAHEIYREGWEQWSKISSIFF